jgi:hypothetical protein
MAKPSTPPPPDAAVETFDRLIATRPSVVRKGASIPYTSLNGHMTSYLTPTGSLVLRLSPADRERFLAEAATTLHEAYGIVQKEFVDVPDEWFAATARIAPWFAASLDWVATLKAKPTKRG